MTHISDPPRRRDSKATHDRLVRAALELFATRGYHATTTVAIAGAAGVAEGTIYRHFPTKQRLLNDIYRAATRLLFNVIRQGSRRKSCRARLEAIASGWLEIAGREPGAVRLLFATELGDLLDQLSRDADRQLHQALAGIVTAGKSAGEVRPGPAEVWAEAWLALVVLALERVAEGTWSVQQAAPGQIIRAAWDAIAVRDE